VFGGVVPNDVVLSGSQTDFANMTRIRVEVSEGSNQAWREVLVEK
jgi:hypothetical protein